MKKKILAMFIAAVAATTAITGCGLNDITNGVKTDEEEDSKKKDESDKPDEQDNNGDDVTKPETDDNDGNTDNSGNAGNDGDLQTSDIDYTSIYSEELNKFYSVAAGEIEFSWDDAEGLTGFWEVVNYSDTPLETVGYTFIDLNNDGYKELIVAETNSYEYDMEHGRRILAVYSCTAQSNMLILEGYARNAYYLCDDGTIVNQGSGGYASTCLGIYKLNEAGTELDVISFYYTDLAPNGEDIAVYSNPAGVWDVNDNYLVGMSEDDFYTYMNDRLNKAISIELTPFSRYCNKIDGHVGSSAMTAVYIDYTPNGEDTEYVGRYVIDNSEYSVWLTLYANATVTDLCIYNLENVEVANDGSFSCDPKVLYSHGTFNQGEEMVISLNLPEIAPCNAISYYEPDGTFRLYGISTSGIDGSIVMIPLE